MIGFRMKIVSKRKTDAPALSLSFIFLKNAIFIIFIGENMKKYFFYFIQKNNYFEFIHTYWQYYETKFCSFYLY